MIRTHDRTTSISLGLGGIHDSEGFAFNEFKDLWDRTEETFIPDQLSSLREIPPGDIDRMFDNQQTFYHSRIYDLTPVVISWQKENSARSLAIRSRGTSSYEINRGWFKPLPESSENNETLTRLLNEQYLVLHELSYNLAREVTMFNRWQAGLSRLYIGIAPKIIAGGMHSKFTYHADYSNPYGDWQSDKHLEVSASGDFRDFYAESITYKDPANAFQNSFSPNSNLKLNGLGMGLDAGLTYVIPIGDDLSLSPYIDEPLRKSWRFSIALTDLGMVYYPENATEWSTSSSRYFHETIPQFQSTPDISPGSAFNFLMNDPAENRLMDNLDATEAESYTIKLPTELHFGSALQYDRISGMADLNYRFNTTDFGPEGWYISFGSEIRLLRFLPIQGSIQFDPDRNTTMGVGAGLDLGFLHLMAATRILSIDEKHVDWQADSISTIGMHIRF